MMVVESDHLLERDNLKNKGLNCDKTEKSKATRKASS